MLLIRLVLISCLMHMGMKAEPCSSPIPITSLWNRHKNVTTGRRWRHVLHLYSCWWSKDTKRSEEWMLEIWMKWCWGAWWEDPHMGPEWAEGRRWLQRKWERWSKGKIFLFVCLYYTLRVHTTRFDADSAFFLDMLLPTIYGCRTVASTH